VQHSTGFDSSRKPWEAMARQIVVAFALLTGDWQSLLITPPKTVLKLIFLSASIALSAFAPAAVEAASSCGIASYYGPGFHGRTTANGERFNAYGLSAAHRSLPFGTMVKVTNQNNGKSITIRINDDGPHVPGRIIDLSEGAFSHIASKGQGLASVCISKV
jgi:rare lipoprotein A